MTALVWPTCTEGAPTWRQGRCINSRYATVSEVKRLEIYNGYMQRPFPNGQNFPFGCTGHVTAVAAGQSQRPTEVTDGLCVFPCFAVPSSIIRYQHVKCSSTTVYLKLKHELPVQHVSTQHKKFSKETAMGVVPEYG